MLLNLTNAHVWFYVVQLGLLAGQCFGVSACCGLGNSSTKQTTITTEYANSFNRSDSYASSITGGDTSLTIGAASDGGTNPTNVFILALGILGVLGGIALLTR